MKFNQAGFNSVPLRVTTYALAAAVGSGALLGCSGEPTPPEPTPPVIFVGSLPESDPAPVKPLAFTQAEESLAQGLCNSLVAADGYTPSQALSRYENKYTDLKRKYKLNDPDAYGAVSIRIVASDYCPRQIQVFGSKG